MKLTIFQRLTAGYMTILFMVFLFGSFTAFQLNHLTRLTHRAAGADSDIIDIAGDLATRLYILLALEKKYWISGDDDFFRLFLKRQHEFQDQLNSLALLILDDDTQQDLTRLRSLSRDYLSRAEALKNKPLTEPGGAYEKDRDAMVRTMSSLLERIRQAGHAARHEKIKQSEIISARIQWVTLGFAAACIIVGLAVSLITTRRIVYPILELRNKTRDIASGHFAAIKDMKAPPEVLDLAEDFNTMSERLNELDMLKEDFVSHISHALRTPLTSIWEASSMLIRGTFDKDRESRQKLLTIIRDECRRLIESVNRILDLSRMEAGMMDYRFTEVDLNDLISTIVIKLDPIARSKDITMSVKASDTLPRVQADPEAMTQLLENLVGNALKFTDTEGDVVVDVNASDDMEKRICVSISDTGCGIEQEYLDRIFEKFHRIEKGKQTDRGTGLGLAIVKHIADAHGGNIWVKSEKDKGSIFYLSLPCA